MKNNKSTKNASLFITVKEFMIALFNKVLHFLGISLENDKLHDYCNVYDETGNKLYIVNAKGKKEYIKEYPDKVGFIIWNILERGCCPFAGICIRFCYAINTSIRRGHNTIHSRYYNFLETLNPNFVDNMILTIEKRINSGKYKKYDRINIRIHESGDFYSLNYLTSWYQIAKHFKNDKRLYFVAYTTSYKAPWYTEVGKPENMKIIKSGIDYVVVDSFDGIPDEAQCHCKNCGHASYCNKCYDPNHTGIVYVKKHGGNRNNAKTLQNDSQAGYLELMQITFAFVQEYNKYFSDTNSIYYGREEEYLPTLLDDMKHNIFYSENETEYPIVKI